MVLVKLPSATAFHGVLSSTTVGFQLCLLGIWGLRIIQEGLGQEHRDSCGPPHPSMASAARAEAGIQALQANTVRTAAVGALQRHLPTPTAGSWADASKGTAM